MKRDQVTTAPQAAQVKVSRWSAAATGTTGSLAVGLVVLAAVPYFAGGPVEQPLIVAFTLIAMATTWNLLTGFSGLTSFAQHACCWGSSAAGGAGRCSPSGTVCLVAIITGNRVNPVCARLPGRLSG